ncbi:MAG: NAD-dependent epimerase/dehydratase family protein [Spirochaetota bacterium]
MAEVREGTVCVFGVGGPMGSSIIGPLAELYTLRLADIMSEAQVRERPLMKGAPPHPRLDSPHEWVQVDVTDYDQVDRAVEGCDAVINITVNRVCRPAAFRVNLGGTWNILRASARHGAKRVITTGPVNVEGMDFEGDYRYEFDVDEDAPFRAGAGLYPLTKHLSYEAADAFAREHDLDVMTLLVSRLRPHDAFDNRDGNVVIPFSTAWEDLASAFIAALRAPRMERPNERFFVCADLPMGKYRAGKAKRLLGWEAKHTFESFTRRSRRLGE